MPGMVSEYRVARRAARRRCPSAGFSHAITLHPLASADERGTAARGVARLLAPHGQALVAMPLRGSFQELGDLLREYALKHDDAEVGARRRAGARRAAHRRDARRRARGGGLRLRRRQPAPGDVRRSGAVATSSRIPSRGCSILPELRLNLNLDDPEKALGYVRDAIDKYWSDGAFELTVNVGCATGRRVG